MTRPPTKEGEKIRGEGKQGDKQQKKAQINDLFILYSILNYQ
jgi:hypothetical protein